MNGTLDHAPLHEALLPLLDQAVRQARQQLAGEQLDIRPVLYIVDDVPTETFRYTPQQLSYYPENRPLKRTEWSALSREHFFENTVKQLPEYRQVLDHFTDSDRMNLAKIYQKDNVDLSLRELVDTVTSLVVNDVHGKINLNDYVDAFLSELENCRIVWKAEVWLQGVGLVNDQIIPAHQICLQQPTPADFSKPYLPFVFDENHPSQWKDCNPTSILRFQQPASSATEIENAIEQVLRTFRLLDSAPVRCVKSIILPSEPSVLRKTTSKITPGFSGPRSSDPGSSHDSSLNSYVFKEKHATAFEVAFSRIGRVFGSADHKAQPIFIAFEHYDHALFFARTDAARIAHCWSCLEALYGASARDSTRTVRQRMACVLRAEHDFAPGPVLKDMNEAYDVRNKYFHGDATPGSVTSLCEKVRDYARESLNIFLRWFDEGRTKSQLLGRIDTAIAEAAGGNLDLFG